MAAEADERPAKVDKRVDQIGYVNELFDQYAQKLIDAVKVRHPAAGTRLAGEHFEGLIIGGDTTSIPVEKWYGLQKKGKITLKQFLSALKVSVSAAAEILDGATYNQVSESKAKAVSLRVTRVKGVDFDLVDAVRTIADVELPAIRIAA